MRGASASEVMSVLERDNVVVIPQVAGIARDAQGKPIASPEIVVAANLQLKGGSEDDVYRMRAAATSPEAADRLADLDREQAAWKARIDDYLAQRGALLSSAGSEADHQAAVAALRDRLFTPEEQRRLPAYEG